MPLPEGVRDQDSSHCSFEHFEGDSDIGFIRETARVPRPGGAACIVPLYLLRNMLSRPIPLWRIPAGVVFDEG